jgi:hypothetical protein
MPRPLSIILRDDNRRMTHSEIEDYATAAIMATTDPKALNFYDQVRHQNRQLQELDGKP